MDRYRKGLVALSADPVTVGHPPHRNSEKSLSFTCGARCQQRCKKELLLVYTDRTYGNGATSNLTPHQRRSLCF